MNWIVTHGEILDQPADVLVCSANVFLNLSGGVGGAILLRTGDAMQKELHAILENSGNRFVDQGTVVTTAAHGLPFKAVIHAVAVDGFYKSSPEIIGSVVDLALREAASLEAHTVALTALATGYGRLGMKDFGLGVRRLLGAEIHPIQTVAICVRDEQSAIDLRSELEI